jgi:L-ascorbate 6-phosphate lactonase
MLTGNALIADIDGARLEPGELAFWWLGQHSFILKLGASVIYVDPFLSPHPERLVPSLISAGQMAHAHLVLGTHDHGDHIDRESWPEIARAGRATFGVPDLVREGIIQDLRFPAERIFGLDDGTTVTSEGIRITGVAGAHEHLDRDLETGRHPWLGYVIEGNGCRVYHAGDTIKYEGLETRVKQHLPIDLALLPINGRDAPRTARGIIGNMTYQEAVDLAGAIKPRLSVPAHYDMFAGNLEDPKNFVDFLDVKFPGLRVHVCRYGEKVQLDGRKENHETT